jgi:hypothetical protein
MRLSTARLMERADILRSVVSHCKVYDVGRLTLSKYAYLPCGLVPSDLMYAERYLARNITWVHYTVPEHI